jgi:deoxyribodipyrimidine photo-lyase
VPDPGRPAAEAFVEAHLGDLVTGPVLGSERFRGGQTAADAALAAFDVTGYAARRNEVLPESRRGASGLSPYIRHGLLPLRRVWEHVDGGPARDVEKFRDELLWQEFARHWYARLGEATRVGLRREQQNVTDGGWDRSMACVDAALDELGRDGWLVNQTRMWLASDWAVRRGGDWRDGEDEFFRALLDGSRAANRLGWQWTVGVGSSKHYGFSRFQVDKRAPELCRSCVHRNACPIQHWPDEPDWRPVERVLGLSATESAGPSDVEPADPDLIWLTAESLGDDDPAAHAHPELPAVFVFDEPLLARLRLSAGRLVFLVETLAEIGSRRPLRLVRGRPSEVLSGERVAVTHAPVPGYRRIISLVPPVEEHPYPWLVRPSGGSVSSFSAWRRAHSPQPRRRA